MKYFLFFSIFVLLLSVGCRSDMYFQNEAAKEAREFLLDNCPELDFDQRNFVRYNPPVLLHNIFMDAHGSENINNTAQEQICVTWIIPGKSELYMVYGVSDARMQWWRPERIVRKQLSSSQLTFSGVWTKCRNYMQANLIDQLNAEEINQVRFLPCYIIQTDFEVNLNVMGDMSEEELAYARNTAARQTQYSAVWKCGHRNIVFTGMAKEKMAGWDICFVGIFDNDELSKHTVKELITPEQRFSEFPEN